MVKFTIFVAFLINFSAPNFGIKTKFRENFHRKRQQVGRNSRYFYFSLGFEAKMFELLARNYYIMLYF